MKYRKWDKIKGEYYYYEDDDTYLHNYGCGGARSVANQLQTAFNTEAETMFDSGWVTHEKPKLFVSQAIVGVCNAIQLKFPGLEWAILLKGEWTKHGFEIANTYAVPKQEVSGGSVKFDDADVEKYKLDGYNVVLHSHHNMGISFSGPDHDTLTDSSFAASLLYAKDTIKEATISITVKPGVRVAVVPEIMILGFLIELPDWIDDKIKRFQSTYYYSPKDTADNAFGKEPERKEWHRQMTGGSPQENIKTTNEEDILLKDKEGVLWDTHYVKYQGTEKDALAAGLTIVDEDEWYNSLAGMVDY